MDPKTRSAPMQRGKQASGSRLSRSLIAGLLCIGVSACSEGGAPADDAVARGRRVYLTNCTACHNADPTLEGSVGPVVAGASQELLEARILHGNYPPGYTPKNPGAAMPQLPHLAPAIPDLAAYLASVKPAR